MAAFCCYARSSSAFTSPIGSPPAWWPRAADLITHSLADILRFRLLMIAAGYEGGNDASSLRSDPLFKMALDLSPSDRELCSQSTISRLENLPNARTLLRMGRAMVDLYCEYLYAHAVDAFEFNSLLNGIAAL